MGDFDQLEGSLVHDLLKLLVALPVAVSLLDDDAALEQQAFEHFLDVKLCMLGVFHTQSDILEIAEQCHHPR